MHFLPKIIVGLLFLGLTGIAQQNPFHGGVDVSDNTEFENVVTAIYPNKSGSVDFVIHNSNGHYGMLHQWSNKLIRLNKSGEKQRSFNIYRSSRTGGTWLALRPKQVSNGSYLQLVDDYWFNGNAYLCANFQHGFVKSYDLTLARTLSRSLITDNFQYTLIQKTDFATPIVDTLLLIALNLQNGDLDTLTELYAPARKTVRDYSKLRVSLSKMQCYWQRDDSINVYDMSSGQLTEVFADTNQTAIGLSRSYSYSNTTDKIVFDSTYIKRGIKYSIKKENSLIIENFNGVFLAGSYSWPRDLPYLYGYDSSTDSFQACLIKLDDDLNVEWRTTIPHFQDAMVSALSVDSVGNLWVGLLSSRGFFGSGSDRNSTKAFVMKLDKNGQIIHAPEVHYSLFPVPAKDWIVIESDERVTRAEFVDMAGQRVYNLQAMQGENTKHFSFDVASLPRGVYAVRSYYSNGRKAQKILRCILQ